MNIEFTPWYYRAVCNNLKYEINFFDKKQTDTNATQLVFLVSLEPDHRIKKTNKTLSVMKY